MIQTVLTASFLLVFTFLGYAQEGAKDSYTYRFQIENISTQVDEADVKQLQSYAKDLFEAHPQLQNGTFTITTWFPVPENRVRQYLEMYGFPVTTFEVTRNGEVLNSKNEQL
jgi:hypothetical protein